MFYHYFENLVKFKYIFDIKLIKVLKHYRREREGSKLEYYYNEFVKRDWYKDKNLYDNRGRRIHYDKNGNTIYVIIIFVKLIICIIKTLGWKTFNT